MKKNILSIISALTITCGALSGLIGCTPQTPPPAPQGVTATAITADLLDGQIANLMGADGLGLVDKESQAGPSAFGVSTFAQQTSSQKKQELAKDTDAGIKDVHFYSQTEDRKSYKDLNKKYATHHHNQVVCEVVDCDQISDEIEQEELTGETKTVISLDARVNKLYNHGDWTFVCVSSAVSGDVKVLTESNRTPTDFNMPLQTIGNANTYVNLEGHISPLGPYTYSYISIPAQNGKPQGFIPVKAFDTETGYHSANYWSDDYNQSYIIDNKTGVTYSLAQFPYVYSVEGGVIKVYNAQANGRFDYYIPKSTNTGVEFVKIQLPDASAVALPSNGLSVKIDKYGHILFQTTQVVSGNNFNQNGENVFGQNIIVTVNKQDVAMQIRHQNGAFGDLFAQRYQKAKRYHLGSDGRIYRLNFLGDLSKISINVLSESGIWQDVGNDVNVTFDYLESFISYQNSVNHASNDLFMITKIENGYAYYSTAMQFDGIGIFNGLPLGNNNDMEYGEYQGVVKISVNGADEQNVHLDFLKDLGNQLNFSTPNLTVRLGSSKMLFFTNFNLGRGTLCLYDATTGITKQIGTSAILGTKGESIHFENLGYLSIRDDVDFATFGLSNFTAEPISASAHLDAYFKLITSKTA